MLLPFPTRAELARRLPRCIAGLALFGIGIAMIVRGELGVAPWDVFHGGVGDRVGISIGVMIEITGLLIMVLWIPLRQRLGIGTVLNAVEIGLVVDLVLERLPESELVVARIGYLAGGMLVLAVGLGLYLGAGLGAGPATD